VNVATQTELTCNPAERQGSAEEQRKLEVSLNAPGRA